MKNLRKFLLKYPVQEFADLYNILFATIKAKCFYAWDMKLRGVILLRFVFGILFLLFVETKLHAQQTHSYYFQDTFTEGGGVGPALVQVLSGSATNGAYANQTINTSTGTCGTGTQKVFAFNEGGGLSYPNNSFINGTYTIHIFFKFNTGMSTSYKRVIDFKNSTSDNGLYIYGDDLNFYPTGNQGTLNFFVADTYYLITLVRNAATNIVKVYVNGELFVSSYNDSNNYYVPTTTTTPIIFFRDDNSVSGEDAAGAIRFLSLKPVVATDSEVASTWSNICNISSCIPPVITCPSNISVNVESGQCLALVNYGAATATGATEPITYSQNSGTYFPIGTTTITATATNGICSSSCSFLVTVNGTGGGTAGEIEIKGNNVSIANGDLIASTTDHTNFGNVNVSSSLARTFTINNLGGSVLNIQSIGTTGVNHEEFVVSGITLPAAIPASGSTTFTVTLTPTAIDIRSALVQISSDDCDESNFTFAIQGNGLQAAVNNPTSVSATNTIICSGNSTQLTANGAQGTVYWYTASCGGIQVTTGNPVTVSPTTTTTYFARNYDNSQFSSACASVTITVNPLLQYRSKAGLDYSSPRNWTTAANWEQYNGSSWVAATSYPGEISNACSSPLVTILTGHQIEISGVNITLPNLKMEGTGKLVVRSTAKLYVNGQLQLDQNSAGAIVVE